MWKQSDPRARVSFLVLSVVALGRGLLYLTIIPPWQGPDEAGHFESIRLTYELRRIPRAEDASPGLRLELVESLARYRAWAFFHTMPPPSLSAVDLKGLFGGTSTLGRFSLSHAVYAGVLWPVSSQPLVVQLYALRAVSVLIGIGVVLLTWQCALLAFPDSSRIAWGASLFVVFLPQQTFLSATVNDGNLALLLMTGCFTVMLSSLREGFTHARTACIVSFCAAALATKATGVMLLPLVALFLWHGRRRILDTPLTLVHKLSVVLIMCGGLIAALFFAADVLHYVHSRIDAAFDAEWRSHAMGVLRGERVWSATIGVGRFSWLLWRSFWMAFGSLTVFLPGWVYIVPGVMTAAAIAGWRRYIQTIAASERSPCAFITLAAALPALCLAALYLSTTSGLAWGQGRYLYAALVPVALIVSCGWSSLIGRKYENASLASQIALWILFDSLCLMNTAIPVYYHVPF